MNQNINLILIILICFINIIEGSISKYIVRPSSEDVLQRCPGYENNFYDKYFDLSELKFERIAEDVIEVSGIIKYIGDLSSHAVISGEVKFYKKVSGNWIETASLYRDNLCMVLFRESEPWYIITKNVKEENRKCPPDTGLQVNVSKIKVQYIQRASATNIEGEYKLITILRYGRKELVCVMTYATVEFE